MLLTQNDEEEIESGDEGVVVPKEERLIAPEMSLNSMVGVSSPKTLRLKGMIACHEVIVMVDHGATHNFYISYVGRKIEVVVDTNEGVWGVFGQWGNRLKGRENVRVYGFNLRK